MQERRHASRIRLDLPSRWESLRTEGQARVSDLSGTGCFLLSGGAVKMGELIRLEIDFGNHWVLAWGYVVYAIEEMGFALQFVFGEESEARRLANLIISMKQQTGDSV